MLREFEMHQATLATLAARLEVELRGLLDRRGVVVQFVSSRLKSTTSLKEKLRRPDKTYHRLWDVTDLVGLRVATSFEDTIDQVARLIEESYPVDYAHSTDKLRVADVGQFGYRSLHYVCARPDSGLDPAFRFEIQVRTALQHAWAEVEHDLGYKVDTVPASIRRRFSRVASLLEVADQEFASIRQDLEAYQRQVREALADPERPVLVDVLSLDALTRGDGPRAADLEVAQALGRPCVDAPFYPAYLVPLLRLAGLDTSARLHDALERFRGQVGPFVPRYFDFSARVLGFPAERVEVVQRGYGLLFVALLALVRSDGLGLGKVTRLAQLYAELDGLEPREAHRIASALVSALA